MRYKSVYTPFLILAMHIWAQRGGVARLCSLAHLYMRISVCMCPCPHASTATTIELTG